MRTITNRFISVILCLSLAFGVLLGSLAVPKRAHAILPVIGGAAAAAGLSEIAEIGVFAALLAACGFSLANAVGANPDVPIADWSDGQLTDAQRKLQSASEYSEWLDLTYFLNNSPDPPQEPNNDDNGNGKKQPKKEDATSDLDYMIAMMGVNGALAFGGGLANGISGLVKWATAPESEGGGGFVGNAVYPETVTDPVYGLTFRVDESIAPAEYGVNRYGPPSGYSCDIYNLYSSSRAMYAFPTDSATISIDNYNNDTMSYRVSVQGMSSYPIGYTNRWGNTSDSPYIYAVGSRSCPDGSVVSPRVAHVINSSYTSTNGQILHAIQDGNAAIVSALDNMANNQNAAIATLQEYYANDVSTTQAGTNQYITVQSPYYVESGKTDPQTGQYTANIVANDYNHGTISKYDDAVATNTSSPQPGNTGYNPADYKGNSSSDVPPWEPLLHIHLDKVWPFSLIGDSFGTFQQVYSLDGGSEWDWHIVVPLSSWNIALNGSQVFDDYDIDLSMWRDLFAYLAPWFLLYVFLSLLALARRLWLRWNESGGED